MANRPFASFFVFAGVVTVIVIALWMTGTVDNMGPVWVLLISASIIVVAGSFIRTYHDTVGKILLAAGSVMFVLVLLTTVAVSHYPMFQDWFAAKWPFTATAVANRQADTDIRTYDTTNPIGTELRIFLAQRRREQEAEILKGAQYDWDKTVAAYNSRSIDFPTMQARQAAIVRTKEQNLKFLDEQFRLKLKGLPDEETPKPTLWEQAKNFDPEDVNLSTGAKFGILILAVVALMALPKKKEEKKESKPAPSAPPAPPAPAAPVVERRRS